MLYLQALHEIGELIENHTGDFRSLCRKGVVACDIQGVRIVTSEPILKMIEGGNGEI